jgi:serine/threonine protein phosphatase PrpC
MALVTESAAISHVGKIRSNNQDSGYAGQSLFAVADGMGGHAGGDVASAIVLKRLIEIDGVYSSAVDAEFALQEAIVAANSILAETVYEHPELTGMGTTLSALVRVGHSVALAHIGDSRVYRFRDGALTQITADHTFVQRLVDSGRITPEEAKTHPRRSVLMRVLGDVDSTPDVDLQVMDTRPGDRWLICSDGLTGVVENDRIQAALASERPASELVTDLVKQSLDNGAPDNVTIVIVDISQSFEENDSTPVTVGSAAKPIALEGSIGRRVSRLPGLRLHQRGPASTEPSHFEAQSEDYLDELIDENRRRSRRRKITWLVGVLIIAVAIGGALFAGYRWTQSLFYVGESNGHVAIYQGVQQSIGPVRLSQVYQVTDISLDDLPGYTANQVRDTISADNITMALEIVSRLDVAAASPTPATSPPTSTPSPTPPPVSNG